MPNDADALDIDSKVEKWIEAFHSLKKWKRAPNPKLRSGKKRRKSPARTFEQKLAKIRADIGADAIDQLVATDKADIARLEQDLATATTDTERDRITAAIEALEEQVAANLMELDVAAKIAARVQRLDDAEGELDEVKADTLQKIADLQGQLPADAVDLNTLDAKRVAEFRALHVGVQRNIDHARAEIVTLARPTRSGPKEDKFSVINSTEYKILFGMLEQSVLELQLGKLDDAFATVNAAAQLLVTYRNARTGADPVAQKPGLVPGLDAPMQAAMSRIEDLEKRGFATAVADLRNRHDALENTIRTGLANNEPDLAAVHAGTARALEADAEAALADYIKVEKLLAEARKDIATMRGNGHIHRPKRAEAKITAYQPGDSTQDALERAGEIRAYAAEKLADTRKDDLRRAGMSDADLRKQLDDIKHRFDAFLKTDKSGDRKTRKDDKTGQQKLVPKSSKLPDGAVAEIELQLLAAEQLIASGAIDALRMAASYFDGVENFIGAIENDPKIYKTLEGRFDKLDEKIAKIEKSYGLYEPGQRLDLKAEAGDLRKGHLTRLQSDVADDIDALDAKVDDFKAKVKGLRQRKRALEKVADEREATLKKIGAALAARNGTMNEENPFDGYHGGDADRLKTLRAKISERSERSLDEAAQIIVEMGNLKGILDALERQNKGEALPIDQMSAAFDFVADARQGQKAHDDNQAKKKDFNDKRSEAKKIIAKATDRTKDIKGDPTELEALENERVALVAETKDSGKYIEGLTKMDALVIRATRLSNDAKAAAAILDADLESAAVACAQGVRAFRGHVAGFVQKVVAPVGMTDAGNQLDDPALYDRAKIEGLITAIVKAMPDAIIDRLDSNAAILADRQAAAKDRKIARKEALLAVRALMGVFDGFDPLAVFRSHPFKDESIAALESARKALPRLEIRFLKTSIG